MKKKKRADLILILCLLLASGLLFGLRFLSRSGGAVAAVYHDGEKIAEYPLNKDVSERFEFDENGSAYNILEIKDGCASVTEADCPDKICVKSHSIKFSGESITCLPHRLQVVIEGGEGGVDL